VLAGKTSAGWQKDSLDCQIKINQDLTALVQYYMKKS
jgi:hypothetical protein